MRNFSFIFVLAFLAISCTKTNPTFVQSQISLVPRPVKFQLEASSFAFTSESSISIDAEEQNMAATYLKNIFNTAAGFDLKIENNKGTASIVFNKVEGLKTESYQLKVGTKQIIIEASDAAGYFYAVQTLRQLLPVEIESKTSSVQEWLVPCATIEDGPRFSWRGMQMDFSRHFSSIKEVKTFLDYMALYKLNTYHMHLTDDQGWRVEIKKYPLLTEKGAWRVESSHDKQCKELAINNPMLAIDEQHYHEKEGQKMYGGFFTQEEIKEIVKYASDRNIKVIPEIDMPGHFKSAIDNYPYLSCTGKAGWGDHFSRPACLAKETSYEFTKDVLAEIADLFPSEYIHIGGDEVNIKSWKDCPNCQKTIKKNHLKDEHELQSFFNRDIEKFLNSKGKKMIGWDEIVSGGVSSESTIMWWRNWAPKARYEAVDKGADLIITPDFEYYFDFTNESTPLSKVYNYEPVPEDFTAEQTKHLLGIQANLWSERIANFKRLQYQAFPRLLALAETGWTEKKSKDFVGFQDRMQLQYTRMDALHINYYIPSVIGLTNKVVFVDKATITLESPLENMDIFYTLDGSVPTKISKKYVSPIIVSENGTINTIAYRGNIASEVKSASLEKQSYREALAVNPTKKGMKRWAVTKKFKTVEDVQLPKSPKWLEVTKIDLGEYSKEGNISLVFEGYFKADEDGIYEFATKSDDGSLLSIGDKLVVNNGGNHAAIHRDGMIALKKGWHPISIKYHQGGGGSELAVWYKAPSDEKAHLIGEKSAF